MESGELPNMTDQESHQVAFEHTMEADDTLFYMAPEVANQASPCSSYTADSPYPPTPTLVKVEADITAKERLRRSIVKKRGDLDELRLEPKKERADELTPDDKRRREKRKLSNRKAAQKCRQKKKALVETAEKEKKRLEDENRSLRAEIEKSHAAKEELQALYDSHLAVCPYTNTSPPELLENTSSLLTENDYDHLDPNSFDRFLEEINQ